MEIDSKLVETIVKDALAERKANRRWKFVTRSALALLIVAVAVAIIRVEPGAAHKPHTAVIDIAGEIADATQASAEKINASLRRAYGNANVKGIILKINSPGGSPVQSGYVYDEIKRLGAQHPEKKVYAVIEDLGASGAYYIASAADEIYADKASLVGSIGVTAASFGFVDLMERAGVERRAYTSGKHKAFLDPFMPKKEEETKFWQDVLATTHQQFIESVKKGRGDRLKFQQYPDVFSGLIWTGEQTLKIGLVDHLGSTEYVAREVIGASKRVDYTSKEDRLDLFARKLGAASAAGFSELFEAGTSVKLKGPVGI